MMAETVQKAWRLVLDKLVTVGEEVSVTIIGEASGSFVGKLRRMDEYYNQGFYQVGADLTVSDEGQPDRVVPVWVIFHVSGVACVSSLPPKPVEQTRRPDGIGLTPDDLAEIGIPPR